MRQVRVGRQGRALYFFLLVGGAAGLSSCSLLGLDQFAFPDCTNDCLALNQRDGIDPAVACELWTCRDTECVFGGRDADGDGAISILCPEGTDCDDGSILAEPGNAELCNGVDDDCNGLIDDVSATAETAVPVLSASGDIGWARAAEDESGLGVTYQDGTGTSFASIVGTASATPRALAVRSSSAAVNPLDDATLVDGCTIERREPLGWLPCVSGGPACPGALSCVTGSAGSFCEPPVIGVGACTTNAECDDGIACDGRELCDPTSPASDTDGCRCADPTLSATRPPCPCSGGEVCVMALDGTMGCEDPIVPRSPVGALDCASHSDCSDGIPCNGIERCVPTLIGMSSNVGPDGCRSDPPALACDACDEDSDECIDFSNAACNLLDLPLSSAGDAQWMASPLANCMSGGALRAGSFDASDAALTLALRGDARLVPGYPLVDATDGCTGAGVSDLAFAGLPSTADRRLPQALSMWIDRVPCDPVTSTCVGRVHLLGHWLENGVVDSMPVRWVSASDGGAVLELAEDAVAVSAAPVNPSTTGGWVAVWAGPSGIRAASVAALPLPAPSCEGAASPCVDPDAPFSTAFEPDALAARSTPPLMIGAPTAVASATTATDVVVATSGSRVLFAWVEPDAVVLQQAHLDAGALTLDGAAIRRPATGVAALAAAHLHRGFASIGSTVAGVEVTEANAGGFVVSWSSPVGTFVLRIADVSATAPMGLAQVGAPHQHLAPFVDATGRARLLGASGSNLDVFPSLCGPE